MSTKPTWGGKRPGEKKGNYRMSTTTKMKTIETAAITNYLIERRENTDGHAQVNLCESQGDQWITIKRSIDQSTARRFGFNLSNPTVERIFAEIA